MLLLFNFVDAPLDALPPHRLRLSLRAILYCYRGHLLSAAATVLSKGLCINDQTSEWLLPCRIRMQGFLCKVGAFIHPMRSIANPDETFIHKAPTAGNQLGVVPGTSTVRSK